MDRYAVIEEEIATCKTGSRTASTALLAWFLGTVWRLEPEEVDDAICDGGGDKGIDALVVEDDLREVIAFQSKHRQSSSSGQGDADLKNLVGAAAYFESPQAVDGLLASKPNAELPQLIKRLDVRSKVEEGAHATRVVFVTNALLDPAGRDYVSAVANHRPALEVWDRDRLAPVAAWTRRPELRPEPVTLTVSSSPSVLQLDSETTIAIALERVMD